MNILILGNIYSLLMNELISKLKNEENKIQILDILHKEFIVFDDNYLAYIKMKREKSVPNSSLILRLARFIQNYYWVWKILKKTNSDICSIHSTQYYYFLLSGLIKRKSRKVICSIYGSDFYKANSIQRRMQAFLLKHADQITFANETMETDFNKFHKNRFAAKTCICRFGMSHLEIIDHIQKQESKEEVRKRLRLPARKTIIMCGYGRSINNQHEEIIKSILVLDQAASDKIFLIFPMSYGKDIQQIQLVKNLMEKSQIPYLIIETFISDELMCEYVIACDIFINVPKTDQLNGAMLEMLFAGNQVINGAWLPYDILDIRGISTIKTRSIPEIKEKITDIIHYGHSQDQNNRKLIWDLCSWQATLPCWESVYFSGS